jgi:hypothetical protein
VTVATTPGAFLAALKTQIQTRVNANGALAGVKVYLVPPPEDELASDFLVLVRDTVREGDRLATAQRTRARDETVTIPGIVQAHGATRRGGDDAFQAAMNKAGLILDELVLEMRDNPPQVGRQTRSAIVANVRWQPFPVDNGGWLVRGEYDLTYTSRVS